MEEQSADLPIDDNVVEDLVATLNKKYGDHSFVINDIKREAMVIDDVAKDVVEMGLIGYDSNIENHIEVYLSDYNGREKASERKYRDLNTSFNINSEESINSLVQSLTLYYSQEVANSFETIKSLTKKLYNHLSGTYPRIPNGIGASHVEIYFRNGNHTVKIYPLSKEIYFDDDEDIFSWSELTQ